MRARRFNGYTNPERLAALLRSNTLGASIGSTPARRTCGLSTSWIPAIRRCCGCGTSASGGTGQWVTELLRRPLCHEPTIPTGFAPCLAPSRRARPKAASSRRASTAKRIAVPLQGHISFPHSPACVMTPQPTILAIDAAWTATQPSGVALVQQRGSGWHCTALAPSYLSFIELVAGIVPDWSAGRFSGTKPNISSLLEVAEQLAGQPPDLVTLDMPIARTRFSTRRPADQAVSREFSSRWCAAHSPTAIRPGPLGARISETLSAGGYELATTATLVPGAFQFLEVYPHPALLSLLQRSTPDAATRGHGWTSAAEPHRAPCRARGCGSAGSVSGSRPAAPCVRIPGA